ncbi:unnamed protein product [Echinostoma caproni]|uniref:Ig-like domain-containing protein n=1 Tax=Echinostoma caproni TaxID=27848 RepID=A0A183A6A2_9TREM|nr:unnamed protein product [Echinostoma caproni]
MCQTCLRRSCWTEAQRRNAGNELAEDLTQSWDWMRDDALRLAKEQDHKCCGVSCYSNPSCQEYYNPVCQRYTINQPEMEEVCLQGQTLKFTLNPEFDLNNGSYLCHLRHNPPDHLYYVRTWLVIDNRLQTDPVEMEVTAAEPTHVHKVGLDQQTAVWGSPSRVQRRAEDLMQQRIARQKHGQLWLWDKMIQLEHQSKLPIWPEAIVKRESGSDQLTLYRLKTLDEFGHMKPELQKHRDEKYVVTRPFLYNTESWGNQSCHLNISHLHQSQPIYAESTGLPIMLTYPIRIGKTGAFEYLVDNRQAPSAYFELKTHSKRRNSVLRFAFCSLASGITPTASRRVNRTTTARSVPVGTLVDHLEQRPQIRGVEQIQSTFNAITCTEEQIWRITVHG